MQKIGACLLGLLVGLSSARPEGFEYGGEGRAITDEALRKFYYDLYDQENDSQDNHDRHQIDIDDYFDDSVGDAPKEEHKVETPELNFKNFNKNKKTPQRTKPVNPKPILKSVSKGSAPSQISSPTPSQSQAESSGSRDPTFVLSQLLFHLSQLPQ